jgi:transposase
MTITLEVGDIGRFKTDGDFASYCRLVEAQRWSNDQRKADNNAKCGNRYLAWAFVEAANFARRFDLACRQWYDRKAAKTNGILATKALGCKLAKAAWHMMRRQTNYDAQRLFPAPAAPKLGERKKTMKAP